MLNDRYGGHNAWRRLVTINPAYVSPFAPAGTTPKCVVQFGDVFLRHSRGPNPESSWDVYGDDFLNPELALLALCQAPVPPPALARDIWDQLERVHQQGDLDKKIARRKLELNEDPALRPDSDGIRDFR